MLFLLKYNFLDAIDIPVVREFTVQFVSYVKSVYQDEIYQVIQETEDISDEVNTEVLESRKRPLELFVSQEDIESEFLDED